MVAPHVNDIPILLWVRTGAIVFRVDGREHEVAAGSAIWVPAGVEHEVRLAQGTVTVPIHARPGRRSGALTEVQLVDIPPAWGDWLIHKYDFGSLTEDGPLLELAAGHSDTADPSMRLPRLPMPRSREALAVAHTLLRTHGSHRSMAALAAAEQISAKTLQRQFVNETGVVFSEWRTRARVVAAAGRLADGQGAARARRHVGYATPAGFTRAFHRHVGVNPTEYAARARTHRRTAAAQDVTVRVAALVAAEQHPPPPPIPAYSGPVRVNDCHVLLWVYRGSATIRIGTADRHLTRGEAIWVPAGVSHRVDMAPGSILLPLGNRYGRVLTGNDNLRVFSFPPEADSYLLHVHFAEYGLLQPETPPTLTDELFREQFDRVETTSGLTGAVGTIATALRRNPADTRSLAEWAATCGTTPTALGREFASQTGTSFPQWRAQLRMNLARDLLYRERPGQVAHRLGYATPAAFTKVFTAAHGISPRAYQRQVTGQAGDAQSGDAEHQG